MELIAVVGYSDSGKTGLIQKLIPELKNRGMSVAVIKNCPHGFDLDRKGTDSRRFEQAGSQAVALLSPQRLAVLQQTAEPIDADTVAATYFGAFDIVMVEGGKKDRRIPKIWVRSLGEEIDRQVDREDVLAVVSEEPPECSKPVFRPEQVRELADFILRSIGPE
jgi:molybdopterin-guanine dinucleotide biosynthesis protein B